MPESSNPISRRSVLKGAVVFGASILVGGYELRFAPTEAEAAVSPGIAGCATWGAQPPKRAVTVLA